LLDLGQVGQGTAESLDFQGVGVCDLTAVCARLARGQGALQSVGH
jgi:hypothetical protein